MMFPPLYHAHHDRNQEDLRFWLSLAEKYGYPVLELGCGTGRVLLPLSEAGFQPIGLDHDLQMLRYLRSEFGAQARLQPQVVAGDMCAFHFGVQFQLILLPCNTFSTLEAHQREGCLGCVTRHLRQSGIFAVSMPNPELLANLPAHSAAEMEDEFLHPVSGNPVQVSSSWERRRGRFTVTWIYDHLQPDGEIEHLEVQTRHHIHSLEAYLGEFREAGLDVIEIYGDYDFSPYREGSPSLIILAARLKY